MSDKMDPPRQKLNTEPKAAEIKKQFQIIFPMYKEMLQYVIKRL